jgi:isopentenyl diphosphate isomerase/L-lactate dehydrogenase-like FMN-dependent dehydrogenase
MCWKTSPRPACPLWFSCTTNRIGRRLVQRAQRAGCTVVAVTVDLPAGRNTVTAARLRREDTRQCSNCHLTDAAGNQRPNTAAKPMFAGIDTEGLGLTSPSLTWDFVKQLKDMTSMKVVIKGIEAREDPSCASVAPTASWSRMRRPRDGERARHARVVAGGRGWRSGQGARAARWRRAPRH